MTTLNSFRDLNPSDFNRSREDKVPTRFQIGKVYCNAIKNRNGHIRAFTMGSERYRGPKQVELKSASYSSKLDIVIGVDVNSKVHGISGKWDIFELAANTVLNRANKLESFFFHGVQLSPQVFFHLEREQLRRHIGYVIARKYRMSNGWNASRKMREMVIGSVMKQYTAGIFRDYGVDIDKDMPTRDDYLIEEGSEKIQGLFAKFGYELEVSPEEHSRRYSNREY